MARHESRHGYGLRGDPRRRSESGVAIAATLAALLAVGSPARAEGAASAGRLSPDIVGGIAQRLQALQADDDARATRRRAPRIYSVPNPPTGTIVPPGPDAPQSEKNRYRQQIEGLR